MQNHFSVNRAAEVLERTRRTIKRALRDIPADFDERGQPRWRLRNIVDALEAKGSQHENRGTELNDQLAAEWSNFDASYDRMKSMRSIEKRRELAVRMGPQLGYIDKLLVQIGDRNKEDEMLWGCYRNQLFMLAVTGFMAPCEWTRDEAFAHLMKHDTAQ